MSRGPCGCQACEDRATAWLTSYWEGWHGPKAKWNKTQRDRFYVDLALLGMFARDFHFEEPNAKLRDAADK